MSAILSPAIERDALVLVTGVNGYLGSHTADQLLSAGYRVRGTVRDAKKAGWMQDFFDERYGEDKFELVVIDDMAKEGAFDEAMKGVAGVAHTASIVSFSTDPDEVIPQTVAFTLNALKAAAKHPSVKRFVLTSSAFAMGRPNPKVSVSMDKSTWNTADVEAAYSSSAAAGPERPWIVYAASKMRAEQEAWKFMSERKPHFVFNAVLPTLLIGAVLEPKHQGYPSTSRFIKMAFEGKKEQVAALGPNHFVDARDAARLHVVALVDPEVQNERVLGFAGPFNWSDVFAALRRVYPERTFPGAIEGEARDLSKVDGARGAELLRGLGREGWIGFDKSVGDNTRELVSG